VGLTAQMEMSLGDAGLIDFYDQHDAAFKAVAARAYSFTYTNVHPTGLPLRKDDVAVGLVTALQINEDLRAYLAAKKLRPKYWYTWFADLILDRLWKELEDEHAVKLANPR
jgi:hypothetical protein